MRYQQRLVITALIVALSAAVGCASPAGSRSGTGLTASGVKYGKGVSRLGHSIQMGAFADVKNAERFTARLQAKGIEAFYFRKDNGIYAVRFGDFASKEKARAAAQRLVRDGLISGYYIAPPDEVVFGSVQPSRGPSDTRLPSYQAVKPPEIREPRATRSSDERDMGFIAARTAERFIGIPYQWGGNTVVDGLDCSGFVRAVYNLCGVSIPRTSREQYKAGSPVARDDLKDGDLLFFGASASSINHVGIYVGNGTFVHAPKRGEEIKTAALNESYFERRFVGARRYFQ
ncbi:NlpC/P60 family protein [Trichlorobacter sp.]|uniref:NlpC/P60 family protein n=1 Tax=Trichlorobacter sp. TaxID=2911007 RepID=UPI002A362A16|nr:NlpC/P60 family protein [Trichlorobacter sp.]MDY0384103.1 NlpC/P60 family protein [Trichlorobacter sp.]